jgi:Ca2+-binding RTX toxin-like protein
MKMARVELESELNGKLLGNFYDETSLDLRTHTDNKAVYLDTSSGNKIVLEGDNLSYSGNRITGGEIDEITFRNDNGEELAVVVNFEFDAERLSDILLDRGVNAAMKKVLHDDDRIIGSGSDDRLWAGAGDDVLQGRGGDDRLEGWRGDDTLVGGGGSDLFVFKAGDGHDVVRDFDASGGGNNQDYIGVESLNDFDIVKDGNNTVIEFESGDTLTLLDVRKSQVTDADFHLL